MPHGGSACCGTCWFNARNKGEAGFGHANDPEPSFYTIRGLAKDYPAVTIVAEPEAVVNEPRSKPGKDVWLFGGGSLFRSLTELRLVDPV